MTRDDLPAPDQLGVPSVEVVDRSEEAGQRLTLRHDSAGEVSSRLDDAVAGRVGDALAEAVRPRFSGAGWTTRRHHDPALPLTVSGGDGEAVTVSEGRDGRVLLEIETASARQPSRPARCCGQPTSTNEQGQRLSNSVRAWPRGSRVGYVRVRYHHRYCAGLCSGSTRSRCCPRSHSSTLSRTHPY